MQNQSYDFTKLHERDIHVFLKFCAVSKSFALSVCKNEGRNEWEKKEEKDMQDEITRSWPWRFSLRSPMVIAANVFASHRSQSSRRTKLTAINAPLRFDPRLLRRHSIAPSRPLIAFVSIRLELAADKRTGTCHTRYRKAFAIPMAFRWSAGAEKYILKSVYQPF